MKRWEKTPTERYRYRFNWTHFLAEGEEILSSTWTVPAGIELIDPAHTETTVDFTIDGGTLGRDYIVTNHVTTTTGNKPEKSARFTIVAVR